MACFGKPVSIRIFSAPSTVAISWTQSSWTAESAVELVRLAAMSPQHATSSEKIQNWSRPKSELYRKFGIWGYHQKRCCFHPVVILRLVEAVRKSREDSFVSAVIGKAFNLRYDNIRFLTSHKHTPTSRSASNAHRWGASPTNDSTHSRI